MITEIFMAVMVGSSNGIKRCQSLPQVSPAARGLHGAIAAHSRFFRRYLHLLDGLHSGRPRAKRVDQ